MEVKIFKTNIYQEGIKGIERIEQEMNDTFKELEESGDNYEYKITEMKHDNWQIIYLYFSLKSID